MSSSSSPPLSLSRKLTAAETQRLKDRLRPLFGGSSAAASGGEEDPGDNEDDIGDLLDYTIAMISNQKDVEYVSAELNGMDMGFCPPSVTEQVARELQGFLRELRSGSAAPTTPHKPTDATSPSSASESSQPPSAAPTSSSSTATARVVSLRSDRSENALTMAGALGSNRKFDKPTDEPKQKKGKEARPSSRLNDEPPPPQHQPLRRDAKGRAFDRLVDAGQRNDRSGGRGSNRPPRDRPDDGGDRRRTGRGERGGGERGAGRWDDSRGGRDGRPPMDRRGSGDMTGRGDRRGGRGDARGEPRSSTGGDRRGNYDDGREDFRGREERRGGGGRGGPGRDPDGRTGPRGNRDRGGAGRNGDRRPYPRDDLQRPSPPQQQQWSGTKRREGEQPEEDFIAASSNKRMRGPDEAQGYGYDDSNDYNQGDYYATSRGGGGYGSHRGGGRGGRGRGFRGRFGAGRDGPRSGRDASWQPQESFQPDGSATAGGDNGGGADATVETEDSSHWYQHPSPIVAANYQRGGYSPGYRGRGFARGGRGAGRSFYRARVQNMLASKTWVRKKEGDEDGAAPDMGGGGGEAPAEE